MKPSDRKAFAQLVSDVHAYYRQDVSEFTLNVWWEGCQEYDLELVTKAFTTHAKDPDRGSFCPRLSDIERILRGTTTDRAAVAWGAVMRAIGAVGAYQDVDFGDPAAHAAIHDLGGWPKVCRGDLRELGHLQHRFCESYRSYIARGVTTCPAVLMGDRSPDAEYERRGLPPPKPALIGQRPCAEVLMPAIPARAAQPLLERT